jgi:hypothetical protein
MHQTQSSNKTETAKTSIPFETFVDSAVRMGGGTGTYSDLANILVAHRFCDPRLGFGVELSMIRESFLDIVEKINKYGKCTPENWLSPFLTKRHERDIENLVFLVRNQFAGPPLLDTNIPLDDHFRNAFKNHKENNS